MSKWFDRLVLLVLENHGWEQSKDCKFVDWFAKNGVTFNQWRATTHPSGPNYRMMFSGNTWSNNEFDNVKRPCIGDEVVVNTVSFRGTPADRHNPMKDMQAKQAIFNYCWTDPAQGILYLGMDDDNDAHNGPLETADANVMEAIDIWEKDGFGKKDKVLLVVTFDEAFGLEYVSNRVFTGMAGCDIRPGDDVDTSICHYDFARMLYENWGVPFHNTCYHSSPLSPEIAQPLWMNQ